MSMNEPESNRTEKSNLDKMLEQSSLELGKLAAIYRRHGFTDEAREISETAERMNQPNGNSTTES